MSTSDEWLSVQEASALVGVSPATLRRWSDAGQVSVWTTPGGHRRFARATLVALLPGVPEQREAPLGASAEALTLACRRALPALRSTLPWLDDLDEADREPLRQHGRRITAALVAALDPPGRRAGRPSLAVAASSAAACGRIAMACGVAWTDVVEAFLRLRMTFLQQLADGAHDRGLGGAPAQDLVLSAATAFDDLLLALVRDHQASTASEVTDR